MSTTPATNNVMRSNEPLACAGSFTGRRIARVVAGVYLLGLIVAMLLAELELEGRLLENFFQEGGAVEGLQLFHIALSAVAFFFMGVRRWRTVVGWFMIIFGVGLVWTLNREMDYLWKRNALNIWYHSMKVLLAMVLIAVVAVRLRVLWETWIQNPWRTVFVLIYVAIGGYAAAQLLSTLAEALGAVRVVRRSIQEGVELLAGTFFAFAAMEAALHPNWLTKSDPLPAART